MPYLTVDFHNHLMPGADDGAQDAGQAEAGVRRLYDEGIRTLVATVHYDASTRARPEDWEKWAVRIDAAYAALEGIAVEVAPGLSLCRGAEVRLDTRSPDLGDERLRLGATRFVLVELPSFAVPPMSSWMLGEVAEQGCVPILAHAERYRGRRDIVDQATEWRSVGALLQVNHGSLSRRHGRTAQRNARGLLAHGLVDYLATDFHSRGTTWIEETVSAVLDEDGGAQALETFEKNAGRLVRDQMPLEPPRVRFTGSLTDRLRDWWSS